MKGIESLIEFIEAACDINQTKKGYASIKRMSKLLGLTEEEREQLMDYMDYPISVWEPKK